ncbi:methyltransferase domain-containing protein [Kaarinaea lacus]
MVAFTSMQKEHIVSAVQAMYTEVANLPEKEFHFPTGRSACEFVGYPKAQLDSIPSTAVESFAGVGYPFAVDAIQQGDVVLDIGSGSGTDVFIASQLAGTRGKIYALDMTEAMRNKLERNAKVQGVTNIDIVAGDAERIPLPDASVDVVTSNGVLNLVPDKATAFSEILRVLKPGGKVQIADIVVNQNISDECRSNPALWAECIVGAMEEQDYLALFRKVGFQDVKAIGHLDYFSGSSSEETRKVAASFGAGTVVMSAVKRRE